MHILNCDGRLLPEARSAGSLWRLREAWSALSQRTRWVRAWLGRLLTAPKTGAYHQPACGC
jgi:hypothetical protein